MATNPLIRTSDPGAPSAVPAATPTLRSTNPLIRSTAFGRATAGTTRLAPAAPAAFLAVAAALIHFWVAPEHLATWWAYGAFFLAAAVGQAALGLVLLRRPTPALVFAGLWANLAIVVLYVVERTAGLPAWLRVSDGTEDHSHGTNAATMDYLGTAASVVEVGLIVLLATMLPGLYRRVAMNGLMVVGVALWGLRLAGIL